MSSNSLSELVAAIDENASRLLAELRKQNKPEPSIQPNDFERYPEDLSVQWPRAKLMELALDLYHLALGPSEYIKQQALLVREEQ